MDMANNRLSEGVGKKIVEALKKQSEIEINPTQTEEVEDFNSLTEEDFDTLTEEQVQDDSQDINIEEEDFLANLPNTASDNDFNAFEEQPVFQEIPKEEPLIGNSFAQTAANTFNYKQPTPSMADNFVSELDSFEVPSNIAVLKKLITQLPTGVTRHTGAQIIRQTMEALGISMKSVLQEAQQLQDGLNNSAKECQKTIQEYKKHIISLEKQAQNHQRQYSALNELISLFIQTGR